jgi:hypothetical protein
MSAGRLRHVEAIERELYDGREYIGSLIERPSGQVEACPAAGGSLGLYNGPAAAAKALLAARRGGLG